MRASVTDRENLLRVAAATLEALGNGRFAQALTESASEEGPQADGVPRDIIVNALSASLDWARLEGESREVATEGVAPAVPLPYIPSNQVLALLQTAYEEYLEERSAENTEGPFDPTDPGWVSVAWEKLKALFRGKRRFIRHTNLSSFRQNMPANAVVVLYSDWGTGEDTARRVMQQIRAVNPTHAIHLGDVYYSGTPGEIQKRFLDVLDSDGPPAGCRHFALNANHEMYSGGYGYFDTTLPRFGQEASYFNLRNAHWQLIGLDSGYEDHGLQEPQKEWLTAQLGDGGRRSILLSHHQLFSAYESRALDRPLYRKVEPLLPQIYAWFWGHEHRCIIYGQHLGIKARCIGHGAMPESVPYGQASFPQIPIVQVDQRPVPGTAHDNIHGFAVLRFNGATLNVSYLDEFGTVFFNETL